MHQSIPAVLRSPLLLRGICPPCQSLGWGLCKFSSARGLGICQPRGFSQAFDTHSFLLEYNYTKRILQEKQAYWFISQGQETIEGVCKGTIVLDFMHVFLHCLSSQIYTVKSGAMDMNQRFSVMLKLNQISVDII